MNWSTYINENGLPDVTGSDGGIIIADEEHGLGARIALERDKSFSSFSITCGIYGSMVHTRYFGHLDEAKSAYEAMKPALIRSSKPYQVATILISMPSWKTFLMPYPGSSTGFRRTDVQVA